MYHIGNGNIIIHCKLNSLLTTLVNSAGTSIGIGKNNGNKTGKKKFTYRATAKEFKQYKKGDTITITTKTGPFAVSYKEIKK